MVENKIFAKIEPKVPEILNQTDQFAQFFGEDMYIL